MKRSKRTRTFTHEILNFIISNLSHRMNFIIIFELWKLSVIFVYTYGDCVGARISTLISNSDGLSPCFFRLKLEKTCRVREEVNGKVLVSHQSWHFLFLVIIIKVLFHICVLTWRVSNYVSRQGKSVYRRNESPNFQELYYHFKEIS